MSADDANKHLTFEQFARLVLDAVEAAGLDYLIGGAVAVWAYAEPRTTRDFDLVVNLPGNRIRRLSEELIKRDMLVPPEVILDLLLQPEGDLPINAIHLHTGLKADIFLQRIGDDYRATAIARRRSVDLGGTIGRTYVHAPEDLMLNKVHYFSISGQEKHIRDIAAIQAYRGDEIDWPYFHFWLDQLGLQPVWDEVQAAVDKLLG